MGVIEASNQSQKNEKTINFSMFDSVKSGLSKTENQPRDSEIKRPSLENEMEKKEEMNFSQFDSVKSNKSSQISKSQRFPENVDFEENKKKSEHSFDFDQFAEKIS